MGKQIVYPIELKRWKINFTSYQHSDSSSIPGSSIEYMKWSRYKSNSLQYITLS